MQLTGFGAHVELVACIGPYVQELRNEDLDNDFQYLVFLKVPDRSDGLFD